MKTLIASIALTLSLSSLASSNLEACISSIKVNQDPAVKVSQLEKSTLKAVKECFKDLKTAEKSRQKEAKAALRLEKQRKTLEAKILKLQEKLKKS